MSDARREGGAGERPWRVLCDDCDGLGHDDDLLWPRRCPTCNGTGWEPVTDLRDVAAEEDSDHA